MADLFTEEIFLGIEKEQKREENEGNKENIKKDESGRKEKEKRKVLENEENEEREKSLVKRKENVRERKKEDGKRVAESEVLQNKGIENKDEKSKDERHKGGVLNRGGHYKLVNKHKGNKEDELLYFSKGYFLDGDWWKKSNKDNGESKKSVNKKENVFFLEITNNIVFCHLQRNIKTLKNK